MESNKSDVSQVETATKTFKVSDYRGYIIGFASAVTFAAVLTVLLVIFAFPSKPPPTARSTSPLQQNSGELVFVHALFRHGARAPAHKISSEFASNFPRGKGALTDRGYNHSDLLGKFMKKRYVDTGFLDKNMKPKEMFWRSRSNGRCLSTAATVGAAMFRSDQHKHVNIALVSDKDHEVLLNNLMCQKNKAILEKKCPNFATATGSDQEEELYKCAGAPHQLFENALKISDSDRHINEYLHDLPVSSVVRDNIETILGEYYKVRTFRFGVDEYHDSEVIKFSYGVLIDTLLTDLETAWQAHIKKKTAVKMKFFSTQDWVLIGLLDAFGVLNELARDGPKREPDYNSMIVIELWKIDGRPYVKFLFKSEEVTLENHQMRDLTEFVRNCNGQECSLKKFSKCCTDYRITLKKRQNECRAV